MSSLHTLCPPLANNRIGNNHNTKMLRVYGHRGGGTGRVAVTTFGYLGTGTWAAGGIDRGILPVASRAPAAEYGNGYSDRLLEGRRNSSQ